MSGNPPALSNWETKLINVTTPGLGVTLCEVDISYFQDNCVKKTVEHFAAVDFESLHSRILRGGRITIAGK